MIDLQGRSIGNQRHGTTGMTALGQEPWERDLLAMALDAQVQATRDATPPAGDPVLLQLAYEHCEAVTAEHSRSFYMASRLLSKDKRQQMRALYAFCRSTDDIVDHPSHDVEAKLALWRQSTVFWRGPSDDLTVVAWIDLCQRTGMPMGYANQLIDGVARDLHQIRYDTFAELAVYCYGVASTVGLMSMHIMGFTDEQAIPYAIKLGVALQMTNILRDVAEDWQRGRLYLPRQELERFGVTEASIAEGRVDDHWRQFMRFQVQRTRRLYAEAWPGIGLLASDSRFSAGAAAGLYSAILTKIERLGYDVFSQRAHISGMGKLSRLPGLWWRTRAFHFDASTPADG